MLCHNQLQDTQKLSNKSQCMDQTMRREVRTELHPNNMTRGRPSEQGMKNFHSLPKRKENSVLQRKIILVYWPVHDETDPGDFLLHLCLLPYSLLRFSICLLSPTSSFSVSFYLASSAHSVVQCHNNTSPISSLCPSTCPCTAQPFLPCSLLLLECP